MIEIRWHGRGGQGAWTASNLLAEAVLKEGKHVQSFPTFGPERMGAPIMAFTRISEEPIDLHCEVYKPDVVVILDPTLIGSIPVTKGLKPGGVIISNYEGGPDRLATALEIQPEQFKIYAVHATEIAIRILGRPITNTAMLGALTKATGIVKLESLLEAVKERFPGTIGEKNVQVVKEAYEKTRGM